jgi:hypothetical protein
MDKRDPTRSATLRKRGRTIVARKVFELNRGLRQAVQDYDVAGLKSREGIPSVSFINWGEKAAHKLDRSEAMIQTAVDHVMLSPPDWLAAIIEQAIQKGIDQAAQELRVNLSLVNSEDTKAVHTFAAMSEVTGVANETIRRSLRHVGSAIEGKWSTDQLMRELRAVLEKITKHRLNLLVNTGVVRGVNAGKILGYKNQGIKKVGVMPEWLPPAPVHANHFHDARRRKQSEEGSIQVSILTAGDDAVCDDCDSIANDGPYDIDSIGDLIPAHPNCRCAYVPYGDPRYSPIESDEEW